MVRIWYMADPVENQFVENYASQPAEFLTAEQLKQRTRVSCLQVEVNEAKQDEILNAIPDAQKCNYRDVIEVCPEKMGDNFDAKLKIFFTNTCMQMMKIAVERGDLIVLPAGIYHRFTTDERKSIKAMRLFVGEPVWTPHNRDEDGDKEPARKYYLEHSPESGSLWILTNGAKAMKSK
ncbi:putative 1,2-dihydroxy-3-keto-5-methylthiopentene dioxygenase 2 [Hypsibius exemplaris]|uniref:acireductone dioxygenase (Fe(2+)-requiring) n=1 Tax=Hypsibius exemplaris TaxID=2072580 RepID=A0A1W0WEZ3_HYPEX|nr:putative 1,2-dihydroxy-3-keto-5-methylthiopentene dioxygenase 2 [Hypsibius exemplaris]